jgi:transketolase
MYGGWGCTHHAIEEIGLMRLIPTMIVTMPADAYETEQITRAVAKMDAPAYIALAGGSLPINESERSFELGKASLLRKGDDVTIFGTGMTVGDTLRAGKMLADKGISARVFSMHTIKPVDKDAILQSAKETKLIITIEEHTVIGGLGGAVAEVLADAGAGTPLRRLGLQDVFACMVGSHYDVKNRFGITSEAIVETVLSMT